VSGTAEWLSEENGKKKTLLVTPDLLAARRRSKKQPERLAVFSKRHKVP
jgi:hypothetical protein